MSRVAGIWDRRRGRLIERVRAHTGRDDVSDAVLGQRQGREVWFAFTVAFLVAYGAALLAGASTGASAAVGGGAGGAGLAVGMRAVIVARTPGSVLVVRCRRLTSNVETVEHELAAPVPLDVRSGPLNTRARFADEDLVVAKAEVDRLRAILGAPSAS